MNYARHQRGAVRPYIFGPPSLLDFITSALGATIVEKLDGPSGSHVEAQIGDSMLVMELGDFATSDRITRASVYVYVPDVDAAYQAGLKAGAISVAEPEDKPTKSAALDFVTRLATSGGLRRSKGNEERRRPSCRVDGPLRPRQ